MDKYGVLEVPDEDFLKLFKVDTYCLQELRFTGPENFPSIVSGGF